jgi:hypothetical protein
VATTKITSRSSEKAAGTAKNVTIYMTEREHRRLIKLGRDTDMSYSAIVRRLVDAYATGEIVPSKLPRIEKPRTRKAMSGRERFLRAQQRAARASAPQTAEHTAEAT